jgi:DNA-binding MarR family transcriptional regulator
MKLANSWPEVAPTAAPSEQLYDEYEESDEVDESKDGCGGVCWGQYVLNRPLTSNKMLHELARDVRGVEKKRRKLLTVTQYKTICDKWEGASRPFLRKGVDYFAKFLAKLGSVTTPKGETLATAFKRAKHRQPPSKVLLAPKQLQLLASLCRELQEMAGDLPIMLHQASIAKLFALSQQTISEWIRALKTLGVLRLAEAPIPKARAAGYYFIE